MKLRKTLDQSQFRCAPAAVRASIWQFYRDLKAYHCAPTAPRKGRPRAAEFDRIVTLKTGFVTYDRLRVPHNSHQTLPFCLFLASYPSGDCQHSPPLGSIVHSKGWGQSMVFMAVMAFGHKPAGFVGVSIGLAADACFEGLPSSVSRQASF